MSTEQFVLENPLVVIFKQDGKVICHIHPSEETYEEYGLLVCDLVRHIANAFKVKESKVWKWVDMERDNPTTEINQAN